MGLDWNPGPRAKAGCEPEFEKLWRKLTAGACFFKNSKKKRFEEITEPAFQTLNTPRVGRDASADDWAKNTAFPLRADKSLTKEVFMKGMQGFFVLELVPPCDGIPRYTNGHAGGYVECYSFRADWLKECVEIIGKGLFEAAYFSKLPADTVTYGDKLVSAATEFAVAQNIEIVAPNLDAEPESTEFKLDIVISAGRWCRFWGAKGHWLEAYW
jgi:hypothetical protein